MTTLRRRAKDRKLIGLRPAAALHSMASPEWFTPAPIVERARMLMGNIELDPASCAQANETVRAMEYFTAKDDGLACDWRAATIFLNPPGGRGLVRAFWEKLCRHWRAGEVGQATWIGYSLEQLQTLQACPDSPLDFPLCFTAKRISFVAPGGGKRSPTHANYIAYLPPRCDDLSSARFEAQFEQFGRVLR